MSKMNRWPRRTAGSLAIAALVALTACGGKAPTPAPVVTGQFLDGPVQGLAYRTATLSGSTDAQGRFNYRAGESVTFSIGGMDLPAVPAAAVVTPLDVAGSDDLSDARVVNLLVLLQSLDEDGDAKNGIQLPASAATAAAGAAGQALGQALRTESAAAFRATLSNSPVLAGQSLVDERDAVVHFAKTLILQVPNRQFTTDEVVVAQARVVAEDGSDAEPGVGMPVRIRFDGRNLDDGLTVEAGGVCATVEPLGTATDSKTEFTCTPSEVGPLTVSLKRQGEIVGTYTGTAEPLVLMTTTLGSLTIRVDTTRAPVTAANFLRYVDDGYYNGTVFHRIVSNFMVQGGGFVLNNNSIVPKGGTYAPIVLERTTVTGLSNLTGTVAMARTSVENSATSQFYINTVDNLFLDGTLNSPGYAVFGRVVAGVDTTLQALRAVQVVNNGAGEVSLPVIPPSIIAAERVR